jgi:hypothetical protein
MIMMRGKKKIYVLTLSCIIIAITSWIFYSPIELTDLITGIQVSNFSISWPKLRIFIEPLYGFSFYALTLERTFYKAVLISWTVWSLIFVLIYCKITRKNLGQSLVKVFYILIAFASLAAFVALFPLPGPKLIKPQGYIAVDLHSHSRFSHDGVSTEKSSFKFHSLSGYDIFFITEHQNTKSFKNFSTLDSSAQKVFCGMQIQAIEGVSVLLLSKEFFDGGLYNNLGIREIIKKAHESGMFVIMPHWWKWHKFSFSELKGIGVNGFEIYNNGYRNFAEDEREALIDFSKKNSLLMIASTDWHGWGYMTDAWTVFLTDNFVFDDLEKYAENEQIILYRQKQSSSFFRFLFEPFFAYYYYMKNTNTAQTISFICWFIIIFSLFAFKPLHVFWKYFPLFACIIFAASAVYYIVIFIPVYKVNTILPFYLIPSMWAMSLLWLIIWRLNGKTFQ